MLNCLCGNLFLLQEKSDIRNMDDAKPLVLKGGNIEFENVHFR